MHGLTLDYQLGLILGFTVGMIVMFIAYRFSSKESKDSFVATQHKSPHKTNRSTSTITVYSPTKYRTEVIDCNKCAWDAGHYYPCDKHKTVPTKDSIR